MKTTNLFKAIAFVAMIIVSVMNSEVKFDECLAIIETKFP